MRPVTCCDVSIDQPRVAIIRSGGTSSDRRGGSGNHASSSGSSHRNGSISGSLQPLRHPQTERGLPRSSGRIRRAGRGGCVGGSPCNGDDSRLRKMSSSTLSLHSAIKGSSPVAATATEEATHEEEAERKSGTASRIGCCKETRQRGAQPEQSRGRQKREGGRAAAAVVTMPKTVEAEAVAGEAAPRSFFIRLRSSNTSSATAGSSGDVRNSSSAINCNKPAEEQRLLAAGIAAEATRAPPRDLVARRIPHDNHKAWDISLSYTDKIRQLIDGGFVRRSLLQKAPPSTASICGQFGIPNHLAMLEDRDRVMFYKEAIRWQGPAPRQQQLLLPLRQAESSGEQEGPLPQLTVARELQQRPNQPLGRSQVYGLRVLEIGCGPLALLSLLAVQQGAARVDALELNPGVYQFASTFVQQIGVNALRPQQYGLEEPQKPRLRVFRCYSKLFPLASWRAAATSLIKTPFATTPPPLPADTTAATPVAAASDSSVVLLSGFKGEEATAATTTTVDSGSGVAVMGGCAVPRKRSYHRGDRGTAVCAACSSTASLSPAAASALSPPTAVPDTECRFDGAPLVASAATTAANAEAAEFQSSAPSWIVRPLPCPKRRRSQRIAKGLRASPRSSKNRCRTKRNSCCRNKDMATSSSAREPSRVYQEQHEGELYDMVLHEILGDFASQEGAADVIRDIQERTGAIPQSIPFAARTFVGVSELPSPCCIKCPASEHPERTVLSPRERLLQSRRTLLFEVEKGGLFAGLLVAIEVEIRPVCSHSVEPLVPVSANSFAVLLLSIFVGASENGQCDSWYTNVVLLGKEISVSKGDRILVKTEANLTNFQREQHMAGSAEAFGPIVIDFDEQACCVQARD
ncbi:hypothetical protein, conserved [Eimeria praecox]|uniref:Uncharacterized protein n=1 Tax=Eimeria praecox TaxID=51316 RepID=U6H1L5_9EIME|nr:hypothetical protein, conserved [Eimeria praecox]